MTDNTDHCLANLIAYKDCLTSNFEAFKKSYFTHAPLQGMHTLYQLIQKLFLDIENYHQQIKICEHSSWSSALIGSFMFQTSPSAKKQAIHEAKKSLQPIKTTLYVMLHERINKQIDALKDSVETLLKLELYAKVNIQNQKTSRMFVELATIKTIATQIRWVESFLTLSQKIHPGREKVLLEKQTEATRVEKFEQVKKLFHGIYATSMKNLMKLVIEKLSNTNKHDVPYYFIHTANHIREIQSYANYCILFDATLQNEIVDFNRSVLKYFGEEYPTLQIVLIAQQTIFNTGAAIDTRNSYQRF